MDDIKLYLAPLQGYTNADYRNLHHKYFGGIDKYYSPYLRFEPNKELKKSVLKDLHPDQNQGINFVPQLLGSDVALFIELAQQMEAYGYQELNWNLGCPYPMVTNRGFGSALVQKPDQVKEILDAVLSKINIPLSIKCRLGFESKDEINALLEVLNHYPLKELCIHTRIAKQLYKGSAQKEAFVPIINQTEHPLVYNGDIQEVEHIDILNTLFQDKVHRFMIGRGLLRNPFLAAKIKGESFSKEEKQNILTSFHEELLEYNQQKLQPSHLLGKMISHWEYLSYVFENQHKSFKAIKKCKRIDKYTAVVDGLLKTFYQ